MKVIWCFVSVPWGGAEYRCPVLRGIVGPLFSVGGWLSAEDPAVGSVSPGFLMEFVAPFSAPGLLDLFSRWPAFSSLTLVLSFLLHTAWEVCESEEQDLENGKVFANIWSPTWSWWFQISSLGRRSSCSSCTIISYHRQRLPKRKINKWTGTGENITFLGGDYTSSTVL